jgi:hypothetical protein
MVVVALVCIAVCGGLVQPALAEPDSPVVSIDPAAETTPPPQVKSKPKTSCKREASMGSNVKRKTCTSQEDLERQRADSARYMEEIRRTTSNSTGG